jgi:uncharacterized SAM-binding protein YcdF (DUF218 family)
MKIGNEQIILFSLSVVMLLSMRSAVRILFLIYTFVSLIIGYSLIKLNEFRKKTKEETLKLILFLSVQKSIILGISKYLV